MAIAREVIGDTSSQQVVKLTATVNRLLLILEQVALEGGTNALLGFDALYNAISTGVDDGTYAVGVATDLALEGVKATPVQPPTPARKSVAMDNASKFV